MVINLKMFTNGIDFVVAEDTEEAKEIMCKMLYGENISYVSLDDSCKRIIDFNGWYEKEYSDLFTLYDECSLGGVTQTIEEWTIKSCKGYFASSEF